MWKLIKFKFQGPQIKFYWNTDPLSHLRYNSRVSLPKYPYGLHKPRTFRKKFPRSLNFLFFTLRSHSSKEQERFPDYWMHSSLSSSLLGGLRHRKRCWRLTLLCPETTRITSALSRPELVVRACLAGHTLPFAQEEPYWGALVMFTTAYEQYKQQSPPQSSLICNATPQR